MLRPTENGGAWHTDPGLDAIFYVYGNVVTTPGSLQFSAATYSVIAVLVVLGILVIAAPDVLAGLTMPMQRPMR